MTDLMTAPAVPVAAGARAGSGRAMLALARVESVRLLRHPFTLAALALFLLPWAYGLLTGSAGDFPVLHEATVDMQLLGLFALGSGALMTANLAMLRGQRHHTEELDATLVLPRPWRVGAVLLALLPYALLITLVLGVRLGELALRPGAVGRPDPAELLLTPAVAVLFGAVGVLVAVALRSAMWGPLILMALLTGVLAASIAGAEGALWVLRLTPITPDLDEYSVPRSLVDRTPGWHLLYVLGLLAVAAGAALARSGGRRLLVPLAVVAALTAGAGAAQFRGDPALDRRRADVTRDPAAVETCRQLGAVQYCAIGEFARWIPAWDEVVRGVLRPAPSIAGPPLVVRQRIWLTGRPANGGGAYAGDARQDEDRLRVWSAADAAAGHAGAVLVGSAWRSDADAATLAANVAFRVLTGAALTTQMPICGSRGALLVWLVGQATPGTAKGLRMLDEQSSGALAFADMSLLTSTMVPDREATPALALLSRPASEVAALVRRNWGELADPATSLERFGDLLGVAVPAAPPAEERTVCGGN
ncbi:hypothetical protein [Dactylosporangium sp. NPDC049140]|uniref:hypothetical protein n=1 Tax=Dactylosporangium sp. NPDC049140 TaxID=3155647 RepID=UPI0033D0BC2E